LSNFVVQLLRSKVVYRQLSLFRRQTIAKQPGF